MASLTLELCNDLHDSCDMGWYYLVQVLAYGFLAVMTLHGIRLDLPHLHMAHQRSPGTPMPWLV